MTFVEIKPANQSRVQSDFVGFFALTESEIIAAETFGSRHRVALYNKQSGEMLLTSVTEILQQVKSTNWQVSIQLYCEQFISVHVEAAQHHLLGIVVGLRV